MPNTCLYTRPYTCPYKCVCIFRYICSYTCSYTRPYPCPHTCLYTCPKKTLRSRTPSPLSVSPNIIGSDGTLSLAHSSRYSRLPNGSEPSTEIACHHPTHNTWLPFMSDHANLCALMTGMPCSIGWGRATEIAPSYQTLF